MMNGQWLGNYVDLDEPSEKLRIVVNIDERNSYYEGVAYLFPPDINLSPAIAAFFRTEGKDRNFKFRTQGILPINPSTGVICAIDEIRGIYGYDNNSTLSQFADVEGRWDDDTLSLSWTTELGQKGFCILPRSKAGKPSALKSLKKNWKKYKEYVLNLEGKRYLFRGQAGPWRLRTSYHRTYRADINRYLNEDIPSLHKHLSARTKHLFNLNIPDENGAFFNLIQHHGYPTPLLDWTRSPYVAAYFAYRGITRERSEASPKDKVRIYVFDQALWKRNLKQEYRINTAMLHLSVCEFLAAGNERLIPQQAVSTITNIDDIESYILDFENKENKYLSAIDLPISDRNLVVQELRYMGITAGALFPGLDGACEELKECNFEI
jgi:hypothetical protein